MIQGIKVGKHRIVEAKNFFKKQNLGLIRSQHNSVRCSAFRGTTLRDPFSPWRAIEQVDEGRLEPNNHYSPGL